MYEKVLLREIGISHGREQQSNVFPGMDGEAPLHAGVQTGDHLPEFSGGARLHGILPQPPRGGSGGHPLYRVLEGKMKLTEGKMTTFIDFPIEETETVLEVMKRAEKAGDMASLKWCARCLGWLYEVSEAGDGDDEFYPAKFFNMAWAERLRNDPQPEAL